MIHTGKFIKNVSSYPLNKIYVCLLYKMSFKSGLMRIENSHYKPLPPQLPSTHLEMEIQRLREENKKLEAVIQVLCKENSQLIEAHNQRNSFAKEERKELDRMQQVVNRLPQVVDRVQLAVKEMVDGRRQNHSKMQEIMKQASYNWHEFCSEMNVEGVEVEKVLEDIKERIIEKEIEEIIIGMKCKTFS